MFSKQKARFTFTISCLLIALVSFAHNGSVSYAYPLGKIAVDGRFNDWPVGLVKYPINTFLSEERPGSDADFNGFFQVGYRADNRSLYIAFTITDDDFKEDSSGNAKYNTQDGLELSIDGRHLPIGSGVASFMYSKHLRNTNHAYYDPFAKAASWNSMEVAMVREGNKRFYEWRIMLGDQFAVNKSIGFDFLAFDKDGDGTFTFAGWGKGEYKVNNPRSLGDILLLPANAKLAMIQGNVAWDKKINSPLPGEIKISNALNSKLWIEANVDSFGNYAVNLPAGKYLVSLPETYFESGNSIYGNGKVKFLEVVAKAGGRTIIPAITIPSTPVPTLIPEKGILHNFTASSTGEVDKFIETYLDYYRIAGASLALIKDGKLVYHKTYGVKNTMTREKVDSNTLFEAASVTKPVFSFAVMRLAERGVIDLDKPLYEYLPYPDIAHDERYKLITAKHVLTHRTGFPNWRSMTPDGKLALLFTPGTKYNYSGEGFEYLKMVIQTITGKNVEQVLKEEVIEPMGLYHTFFSRNDSLRKVVANGHIDMLPNYDELPEWPGMAYSMHTEAKIFTRFMLYMLEQKGLKPATYDSMFSKQSEFPLDPDDPVLPYPAYMGISLEIRETPFGKSFGHGGNNGDFKCQFVVYKDAKMGYAVFTNSNNSDKLLEVIRQFLVEGKP